MYKLKLADAWNLNSDKDAEKLIQDASLVKFNETNKAYCAAVKETHISLSKEEWYCERFTNRCAVFRKKLTDERVAVTIDTKI